MTIIREEDVKLFIALGAALEPLSKCKLFLKDNSEIIHPRISPGPGRGIFKLPVVKCGRARGALELKNS